MFAHVRFCDRVSTISKEVSAALDFTRKDNLKSIKTKNTLNIALLTLLGKYSFEKITVRDICEEALISRAAFYAHFGDKYDFLTYWLTSLTKKDTNQNWTYEQAAAGINKIIAEYKRPIRNLVCDARKETLDVLFAFLLTTLSSSNISQKEDARSIVASNFYAGGMLFYLLWQVEHKFPKDVIPVNEHLYEIVGYFQTFLDERNY